MANNDKTPKQKVIDQTIEDSFPASDPPSTMQPDHPEEQLQNRKNQSKGRPDEVQKSFSKDDFMPKSDTKPE